MPTFFQTNIPFFLVLLAGIFGALFAFFLYRRTVPPVRKKMALFLAVLRGIYITAVILLLFKPELTLVWRQHESRHIPVLVDRSGSMNLRDNDMTREERALNIAGEISDRIGNAADIHPIGFDTDTLAFDPDVTDSTNAGTDIARALLLTEKMKPAPDAIILISDGNYSVGNNPLFSTTAGRVPVYTIGLGDTVSSVDLIVTDLQSPKIVYQNKVSEIRANIMATGIDSVNVNLELRQEGKVVGKKVIFIRQAEEEYSTGFDIAPPAPGRYTYELYAEQLPQEKNKRNNHRKIRLQVLKEKLGVALLTASPDNDYKFIKLLLEQNDDLKVQPVMMLGRRIGPRLTADSVDVVVWNKIPGEQIRNTLVDGADLSGAPVLLIVSETPGSREQDFLNNHLKVTPVMYSGHTFQTQVRITEDGLKFSPLNVLDSRAAALRFWQSAPPIDYPFIKVSLEAGVHVLLQTAKTSGGNDMGLPVLLAGTRAGRRSALFLGSGFWRWHFLLTENADFKDTWKQMLHNLIRWLAGNREAKNVQISIDQENPTAGKRLKLTADVYDGSFEPVDTAIVRFQVSGPDGSFELSAQNVSEGKYQSEFVPANEGGYKIKSIAWLNDQLLGSDSMRVEIMPVNQEFIHTNQNTDLLRKLAQISGGYYFQADQADSLYSRLDVTRRIIKYTETYRIWDRLTILLIIIALLALEWFLRRRRGLA